MTKSAKVKLEVPEGISDHAKELAREAAVLALWEAAEFSTGEAAEELGLSYHDFLDLLAARGIPAESGPLDREAIEAARRKLSSGRP
jgi:predicted HTH domain antitoxin